MASLLFSKMGVQPPHLLHARLLPFSFLLRLSLLSLAVKIILCLASSDQSLYAVITTSFQYFNPSLLNACRVDIFLFMVAIFIVIIVFFFQSKGGLYLTSSSEAAKEQHDTKPYDTLDRNRNDIASDDTKPYDTSERNRNGIASDGPDMATLDVIPTELPTPSTQLPMASIPLGELPCSSSPLILDNITSSMEITACEPPIKPATINLEEIVPTNPQKGSSLKGLIRYKSDSSITTNGNHVATKYKRCERTVSCTHYYEFSQGEACSTARLYTASSIDSLSKEAAAKCFSDFTSRNWSKIRK